MAEETPPAKPRGNPASSDEPKSKRPKLETELDFEETSRVATLAITVDAAPHSSAEPTVALPVNTNVAYMQNVEADVAIVLEKCPDLTKASGPLTIEQGSDIKPFDSAEFCKFIARKSYRCAFNALWVDRTTPTPEQRLSQKKKDDLQEILSKRPELLVVEVHVDKSWSEKEVIAKMHGSGLQLVVPAEPLHAWWGAFAAYVKDENEEKIKEWQNLALSMPVRMVHLDSVDDRSSESMNYRELLKEMGDILRVTPLMRILHFSSWKATYLKNTEIIRRLV